MSEARRALVLLDSIAHVDAGCAGQVVVSGSHGGTSAAGFVLAQERPPLACFFNDAGVGKEGAGVAGLALLQPRGTVAATYSHDSARIGDAADGAASGIITHLNAAATAAGLAEGMRVADAVVALGASAS
jgi:hypothetical protein